MGYACASVHSGGPHAEFAHGVVYMRDIYSLFVVCVNNFSSALGARLHDLIFTTQNKFRDGALGANATLAKEYYTTVVCAARSQRVRQKTTHAFSSLSNYEKDTALAHPQLMNSGV